MLVQAKNLTKTYHGVQALIGVDFELAEGEIHALVGENGAGKSTLVKILSGFVRRDGGELTVCGRPVGEDWDQERAEQFGVSVIHQELYLAPNLDVASNIVLGNPTAQATGIRRWMGVLDRDSIRRRAASALALLDADIDVTTPASRLSASAAQLVLIARALSRDMRVLILDEPTAALTPQEGEQLFEKLRNLRARGVGIIYVSHKLDEILALSDRITVLRNSKRVATFRTPEADLLTLTELILDRPLTEMYPKHRSEPGSRAVLEVADLSGAGVLDGVSITVREGEIVGVTGLVGAGKSELGLAIYGAIGVDSGQVFFDSQPLQVRSPGDAVGSGIALVPEDRKTQGLILTSAIVRNMALSAVNCNRSVRDLTYLRYIMRWTKGEQLAASYVQNFRIRLRDIWQPVSDLSGGNQQKVVLAKALSTRPRLVILDEPTRGIDIGTKVEIYRMMCELADSGVAILLLSSEIPEVTHMSHRVYVMRKGKVVAELSKEEATEQVVMRYAVAGAAGKVSAE